MHILHVSLQVRPEHLEAFTALTLENAAQSRLEPGVARFDVIQQTDDPTRFMLLEVYHTPAGHAAHRETAHYFKWRDHATPMLAEPRTAKTYRNLSPDDSGW